MVRSWTEIENNIVSVERVSEYSRTPKEVASQLLSCASQVNIAANQISNFTVPHFCSSKDVTFPLKHCSLFNPTDVARFITSDHCTSLQHLSTRFVIKIASAVNSPGMNEPCFLPIFGVCIYCSSSDAILITDGY